MKQIAELSITLNASNCKVGSTTLHFLQVLVAGTVQR